MDNSRAIHSIAFYLNHIISLASEGDMSDENDHHHCQHLSKANSIQLPTVQASKHQVHVQIKRNGNLSYLIGKSTLLSAVSSIQPCNFSSIEHSVARLRGRVCVSYSTKAQCRGLILTSQRPRDNARDFVSIAKCQNFKAQDCMSETLWYKGIKGKACCQKLFYWLVLFSLEQKITQLSFRLIIL